MSMDDGVVTIGRFGPDQLIQQLGFTPCSQRVHDAMRALWNIFVSDDELWQPNSATDRNEIEAVLHFQIKPIIENIGFFSASFPKPLDNHEELLIAAAADSHIYTRAFNDMRLSNTFHQTARHIHADAHAPHLGNAPYDAITIFSQAEAADKRECTTPEVMLPEAHFLYLVWHFTDLEQATQALQNTDIPYDERREIVDRFRQIDPAFLIEGDPLSNSIKEAEAQMQALRPKKAVLSVAAANQAEQPTI